MPWTDNKITVLFTAFDKPWASFFVAFYRGDVSTWSPSTEEEKAAFAALIAPENRDELKRWYRQTTSINAMADALRRILEDKTGDTFPIGGE